jgi:hypothetical protein
VRDLFKAIKQSNKRKAFDILCVFHVHMFGHIHLYTIPHLHMHAPNTYNTQTQQTSFCHRQHRPMWYQTAGVCLPTFSGTALVPYGLPCIRELFRFLISLTNPHDRHNSEVMIHMGLHLLTVALESAPVAQCQTLLGLIKDEMCRHLFQVRLDLVVF